MISIHEDLLTLTRAARILPRRRAGRKPHPSTLYRWSTSGCRGVVLETIQIGATRCTSREALGRFFDRLSAPASQEVVAPPSGTKARVKVQQQAERVLNAE